MNEFSEMFVNALLALLVVITFIVVVAGIWNRFDGLVRVYLEELNSRRQEQQDD